MKKRYWIPSVLLIAVGGLLVGAYYNTENNIRKANRGDMEACEILKRYAGELTKAEITDPACSELLGFPSAREDN